MKQFKKISAFKIFRKVVISMKINWKQKLTSRKFWAAVIGFVTAIMVAFGVNDLTIEQVVGLITAASTLIAYIIGEGMVDAARVKAETTTQDESDGE
jgi:uncharacterized membrane protein